VRVVAQVDFLELPLEPGRGGLVVGLAQPQVVGGQADQPADDGAVRTMPLAGGGEGARAISPSRQAPAVCDEDGPTIVGPRMSKRDTMPAKIRTRC
jgi:hypothetical protein